MPETAQTTKVSFFLFARDACELAFLVSFLRKNGLKVRAGTVLRALLSTTTESDLVALAFAHAQAEFNRSEPETTEGSSRPTADFPNDDLEKLDRAITTLARHRLATNRSYLLRALVLGTPTDPAFVARMKQFLLDHPYKNRGRHVAKRRQG